MKAPGAFLPLSPIRERYKELKQPSKELQLIGGSKIHSAIHNNPKKKP